MSLLTPFAGPWTFVAAFAAAILLPGSALAQGPRFLTDTLPPGDPIEILLVRAADLRLSSDQVTRLKAIQRQLHVSNDPLVAQFVAIRHQLRGQGAVVHPRDMTPEQRMAFHAAAQRARPLMQSIGSNNVQAMQEVGNALTPEQRLLVRGWLGEQAGSPPGGGMQFRRGRNGPGSGAGRAAGGRPPGSVR